MLKPALARKKLRFRENLNFKPLDCYHGMVEQHWIRWSWMMKLVRSLIQKKSYIIYICNSTSSNSLLQRTLKNKFPARLYPIYRRENAGILQPGCSDDPIFVGSLLQASLRKTGTPGTGVLREAWRPVSDVRTRSSAELSKTQTCKIDRKWVSYLSTLGIHGHPKSQTCMSFVHARLQ